MICTKVVRFRPTQTNVAPSLPSVRGAGGQWFAVEGVAVVGFAAEVQVLGAKLFRLAEEQISAGLEVKMQALEQRHALGAGEMG